MDDSSNTTSHSRGAAAAPRDATPAAGPPAPSSSHARARTPDGHLRRSPPLPLKPALSGDGVAHDPLGRFVWSTTRSGAVVYRAAGAVLEKQHGGMPQAGAPSPSSSML